MSFKNPYTQLTFNGKKYDKKTLLTLSQQKNIVDWQQPFFQFLNHWLDEQEYVIVQTSGSTGKPKSIKIGKQQMINSARMTGDYFGFNHQQNALLCLPCHYIAGKMMVVRALVWGFNLMVIKPSNNPLADLHIPIDFAAMIPLQVASILENTPEKIPLIRQLIIGGGKINARLYQQLQEIPTRCYATYGMTETITHIAIQPLNGADKEEAFQVLPNVAIGQDERDCLTISAPHLSNEYIVTNDIVRLKDRQHFVWLGRYDNVINTGGVKVFPEQIEKKLEFLLKSRFFISSSSDEKLGQQVILLIEGADWDKPQYDDFQLKINNTLSKFERPRQLFFLPKFIETPTGKIQRNKTKRLLRLS